MKKLIIILTLIAHHFSLAGCEENFLSRLSTLERLTSLNQESERIKELEKKLTSLNTKKISKKQRGLLKKIFSNSGKKENQSVKKQIAQITSEIQRLKKTNREKNLKALELVLLTTEGQYIQDHLNLERLKKLNSKQTVTILAGTSGTQPDPQMQTELTELVSQFISRGYFILYESNSPYAKLIQSLAQKSSFGISNQPTKQRGQVYIKNTYLRAQALFNTSEKIITTPDSTTGFAGLFNNEIDIIFDPKKEWNFSLHQWKQDLDLMNINMGVRTKEIPIFDQATTVTTAIKKIPSSPIYSKSYFNQEFDLAGEPIRTSPHVETEIFPIITKQFKPKKITLSDLSDYQIDHIVKEVTELLIGQEDLTGVRGAAVFGTGRDENPFENLIFKSGLALGSLDISITTGGAGGAMKTSNTAAISSHVPSVGIPITGKHTLKTEKKVEKEHHSLTVSSSGYETRIPLLLHEKQLVVFVPGGSGTMKEFWITILKLLENPKEKLEIIFVGDDYYSGLKNQIDSSSIPQFIKDRIHFVKNDFELKITIETLFSFGLLDEEIYFFNKKRNKR